MPTDFRWFNLEPCAGTRTRDRAERAYRDKECAFEASSEAGGSLHPFLEARCLEQKTGARAGLISSRVIIFHLSGQFASLPAGFWALKLGDAQGRISMVNV